MDLAERQLKKKGRLTSYRGNHKNTQQLSLLEYEDYPPLKSQQQ